MFCSQVYSDLGHNALPLLVLNLEQGRLGYRTRDLG